MSDWSYPLCGCFDDCSTCLMSYFCTCFVVGENAKALGKEKWVYCCGSYLLLVFAFPGYVVLRTIMRGQVREAKNISGNTCKDCLEAYFCGVCSLTQETRELRSPSEGQAMLRE